MIETAELRRMAEAKLADAIDLYRLGRYDSAIYLCGYGLELALKARICDTLNWDGFPSDTPGFRGLQSFRTHDLSILLRLSGIQGRVEDDFPDEWETASCWRSEWRYLAVGSVDEEQCLELIEAVAVLMEVV